MKTEMMTVELNNEQHAEAGQCGSCQHFRPRDPGDGWGECQLKMPPWLMKYFKVDRPDEGFEIDPRTVGDRETCSFYEAKTFAGNRVQFVQKRYWNAGFPS